MTNNISQITTEATIGVLPYFQAFMDMSTGTGAFLAVLVAGGIWVIQVIFKEARKVPNPIQPPQSPEFNKEEGAENKSKPPVETQTDKEDYKLILAKEDKEISFIDFIDAIFDKKNFSKAKNIIEELIAAGKENAESGFSTLYHYSRRIPGVDVNGELKKLEREHTTWSLPSLFLADHYIDSNLFEEAEKHINIAISRATKKEYLVSAYIRKSTLLQAKGESESAKELIKGYLSEFSSKDLVRLYTELADINKKETDFEGEAYNLEAVLKISPDDRHIRFRLAYLYSKNDDDLASFHHYDVLIKQERKYSSVLNNQAIIFGKHGVDGKKVSLMKEAAENGEDFPATNLSNMLINSGFYEEAKKYLDSLPPEMQTHDITIEARAYAVSSKAEEDKKEEALKKQSQLYYQNIYKTVEDPSTSNINTSAFTGIWRSTDGDMIIENNKSLISGTYETKKSKYKVEGKHIRSFLVLKFDEYQYLGTRSSSGLFGAFGNPSNGEPSWQTSGLMHDMFTLKCHIVNENKLEGFRMSQDKIEKILFEKVSQ